MPKLGIAPPDGEGGLVAAASEFGWGSGGKLRLILNELGAVRVVGIGSGIARPLLDIEDYVDSVEDLPRAVDQYRLRAALVVGHPPLVGEMRRLGLPVVFVDSLPYLWTSNDPVPTDVTVYCAQSCVSIPCAAWPVLRRIERLHWVDAIVPPARVPATPGSGVVVNVGGLHSDFSGKAADAYVRCVLPPVLQGLRSAGMVVTAVCGNLAPEHVALLSPHAPEAAAIGPRAPDEFDALVRSAELLVTSPGSTTLLQAHQTRVPALLLPPQNVSQVLNSSWFAGNDVDRICLQWPPSVLDPDELERARTQGEQQALQVVYGAVIRAAKLRYVASWMRDGAARLAREARQHGVPARDHLDLLGTRGAIQVAAHVRRLLTGTERPPAGAGLGPRNDRPTIGER